MANLSENLESVSLVQGSTCPPTKPGLMRVYNMRFCPYAERALLALHAKNIPHEVVNINLTSKPDWYLADMNPLGKVPTVEMDGKIVYDSLIVVEYLDGLYPKSKQLLSSDPLKRAHQRMLLERLCDKLTGSMYPCYRDPTNYEPVLEALKLAESLLTHDFFGGEEPDFVDLMVWPFIERIPIIGHLTEGKVSIGAFKKLDAYEKRMMKQPAVAANTRDADSHIVFMKSMKSGEKLYDYGVTAA